MVSSYLCHACSAITIHIVLKTLKIVYLLDLKQQWHNVVFVISNNVKYLATFLKKIGFY